MVTAEERKSSPGPAGGGRMTGRAPLASRLAANAGKFIHSCSEAN